MDKIKMKKIAGATKDFTKFLNPNPNPRPVIKWKEFLIFRLSFYLFFYSFVVVGIRRKTCHKEVRWPRKPKPDQGLCFPDSKDASKHDNPIIKGSMLCWRAAGQIAGVPLDPLFTCLLLTEHHHRNCHPLLWSLDCSNQGLKNSQGYDVIKDLGMDFWFTLTRRVCFSMRHAGNYLK